MSLLSFARLRDALNNEDRVEAFDFIRACAALSVILVHFELIDTRNLDVDAFFMLSGFLITQALWHKEGNVNARFFVNRLTKILPSYYFFLVVAYLLGKVFFGALYGENLPLIAEWKQYFLFYRNYAGPPPRHAFDHLWTVSVEEHFYFFVLFVSVVSSCRARFQKGILWIYVLLIFLSQLAKAQAIFTEIAEYPTYTHNRIDVFCLGGLLFIFSDRLPLSQIYKWLLFCLCCLAIIGLAVFDTTIEGLLFRIVSPWCLVGIFICLLHLKFHSIFTILAYYSFNAYLWHYFFIIPIDYYLGKGVLGFLSYVLLTVVSAFLTTHFVEDYFIRKRSYFMRLVSGKS